MNNQQYIQNLCTNIAMLRQRAGLTAEAMAGRMGIAPELIAELERGILPEEMTVEDLVRTEQEFGISIKEMFLPL